MYLAWITNYAQQCLYTRYVWMSGCYLWSREFELTSGGGVSIGVLGVSNTVGLPSDTFSVSCTAVCKQQHRFLVISLSVVYWDLKSCWGFPIFVYLSFSWDVETLRQHQLFSEPTLLPYEIYTWCYPQVYYQANQHSQYLLSSMQHQSTAFSRRGLEHTDQFQNWSFQNHPNSLEIVLAQTFPYRISTMQSFKSYLFKFTSYFHTEQSFKCHFHSNCHADMAEVPFKFYNVPI